MRLDLRPIIHVPGASLPFHFSMDLSGTELYGEQPIKEPVLVSGVVRNTAGIFSLDGEASTTLDLYCDRCTKMFRKEKTVPMHFILAKELASEEEEEEEEIILLDGDELDIGELAFTAFLLNMDMKNLCSDDCKGLCSGCGANLNEEPCRCEPEIDPRWSALSQLL